MASTFDGTLLAVAVLAASTGTALAKGPLRCPSTAELAQAAQSFGTGGDNEKQAYKFFLDRYGRPATFRQQSSTAEMTYGAGRSVISVALQRDPVSGLVDIRCRDSR